MKLKSLLLGSAAAMFLSAGAQAADPMTEFVSLGVCDAYGITGLTIESDDTCLKISGSVSYQFQWGDYNTGVGASVAGPAWAQAPANRTIDDNDGNNDWRSRLETILRFEATTQTDAGAAKAVINFRERNYLDTFGNTAFVGTGTTHTGSDAHAFRIQDAYVSFGDTTVLMAGKKGSIAKDGNDVPFNYLGLANSQRVDTGVNHSRGDGLRTGGHVIQVVSEVADGISVGAALESLDGAVNGGVVPALATSRGTFVAFVAATGAWGEADATVLVGDILDNAGVNPWNANGANPWAFRVGSTFNFDMFKIRGAFVYDDTDYWNALISGEASFDLFTIAASAEFINDALGVNSFGAGASVGFQATDTVAINAGFRYFDPNTAISGGAGTEEGWQAALQVVADVTETITVSGAVGAYGGGALTGTANDPVAYVDLGVAYAPGGGFTTGAGLEANALGAYKLKFDAKKTF